MMLSTEEEDRIARVLSNLTPVEYAQLMSKVKREQWNITGAGPYNKLKTKTK